MVRKYGTLSVGTLTKAKEKNQIRLDLNAYFDPLMLMATSTDLHVSVDNMQMYIVGLTLLKTKLCILHDELDRGSKSVYLEAMEARVCF